MTKQVCKARERDAYFQYAAGGEFPDAIRQLLMEASLLYHVPFGYLVPNGKMLPEESLRFFTIDHNWTLAYMDGICSIGRNASIDYTHDTCLLVREYRQALEQNVEVRLNLQGKNKAASAHVDEEDKFAFCSGFLLRSVLAEEFRGLEFRAYEARDGGEAARLKTLRIEKLGTEVLLGIFRGEIKRLEIAQPPEGLHFGFMQEETPGGVRYIKTLRSVEDGSLQAKTAEIAMKNVKSGRVVDVTKTAAQMGDHMTSAEFALQMIQNAHTGVFRME